MALKQKKSWVWEHFNEKNGKVASCKICHKDIIRTKSSTTSMSNHLLSQHKLKDPMKQENVSDFVAEQVPQPQGSEPESSSTSSAVVTEQVPQPSSLKRKVFHGTPLISNFIRRQSLKEILAECAAKDGFSISAIARSSAIKGFVNFKGYEMPKCEKTIWKLITSFHDLKFEEMKSEIKLKLERDVRFSISLDEWTDLVGRRYLMVNLHEIPAEDVRTPENY